MTPSANDSRATGRGSGPTARARARDARHHEALSRASLPTTTSISTCRPGEIHALLGENGAGKTTLMNVLYGLAVPDEGEILLDGKPVKIAGPSDAIDRGISMVHQHFMLVPVLTVAENIILGEETTAAGGFLDHNAADAEDQRARPNSSASRSIRTPRWRPSRSASSSASRSSRRSTATPASLSSTSRRPC